MIDCEERKMKGNKGEMIIMLFNWNVCENISVRGVLSLY